MRRESERKESLADIISQINQLLDKHKLVENLVYKQQQPKQNLIKNLVSKQNLNKLKKLLDELHPADIADILESLPIDQRIIIWDLVKSENDGDILLEVSDSVRQTLIAEMDNSELLAAAEQLDTDEIADIAPDLPENVLQNLLENLDQQNRERLESTLSYPEDTVGALMDYDIITVREDVSIEVTLRYLRKLGKLPEHTDKLFVVDRYGSILGVLPFKKILVNDLNLYVREVMSTDIVTLNPDDTADDAADAFERYDLITAPVIDANRKLVGRLSVDAVVDYIREVAESDKLSMAGLKEDEDLFSSIWKSVRNRWAWLAINLITALIASRVIGVFEGSIEKVVALAALMPIVAGIGGNSGNQTITMIVRGLALGQINNTNVRNLLYKELGVAILNGVIWGSVLGIFAYLLYGNILLGVVMTTAMLLNLILSAIMGVTIPMLMSKYGKDPAVGSSILITAMTDSGGFFIFLGLATIILI
ncbi:MAG: magnesium transporter [Methylophilaceae bacterium]|nr:magnesium transporter [Methylophilaceae bacterium]MBL6726263.1 magnesium transporter [Methylophilaceae bacterium]MBL6790739.1 magnesium transporter [Methylophilaceae bacterium]